MMRVCALIPAFSEAETIAAVVSAAREYVETVVVIDDGSDDGTGQLATDAGAVCLRCDVNSGKGHALRKGLAHISRGGYTHVLFLDGDGQHRAEDIPTLLRAARETGADLVIGARQFDRSRMPMARYLSNTLGSRVASWLVGQPIHDSQCGFRIARLEKLTQLRLTARKYEFEMEVLIKMSRARCRLAHAPITMVYQQGEATSKMHLVRDTVRICFMSLFYRFLGQ